METIIHELKLIQDWKSKYQFYNRQNHLDNNPISRFQAQNVQNLKKHLQKLSEQSKDKHRISWVSSQYQILQMILNSLSVITDKRIEMFNLHEWSQIYNVFTYKLPLTIKYESLRLIMQKKQPRRRWCLQQQNFLIEIVRKFYTKNKWNDVARQLFIRSNGIYFRQGKHCRERWLNHLHPSIQNNNWSLNEDIKLLTFILKKGKKWARLAKKFDMKRSQCLVKKRFYQLINIQQSESVSLECLKIEIKIALRRLNHQQEEDNFQKIQNINFQYIGNKKMEQIRNSKQIYVLQNKKQLQKNQQQKQMNQQLVNDIDDKIKVPVDFIFPGSLNIIKEISSLQINQYQFIQNYYNNYNNIMVNYLNQYFLPYPSYMIPIENNNVDNFTLNQNNQNNEFQRF